MTPLDSSVTWRAGNTDGTPVFVAGPDRSGTTLLYALLDSHPDLCMVRRTNVWRYFHGQYGDLAEPDNLERCLGDMVRYRRMRHLHPDPERIRREFSEGEPTYGRLFALFFDHHTERVGKQRWGDKSLHTEHYADRVFSEFPNARIVHLVRDPRDRYASVRHRYDRAVSRVGAATGRWLTSTRAGRRNASRYPDGYALVRYEDLVREPEATMQRVCAHVRLAYTPRVFSTDDEAARPNVDGNSSFGDVEPGRISTRAVGRFRQTLGAREVAFIERVAGRDMVELGYELEGVALSPADRIRHLAWDLPVHSARMLGWIGSARARRRRGIRVPSFRLTHEPEEE